MACSWRRRGREQEGQVRSEESEGAKMVMGVVVERLASTAAEESSW